MTVYEHEEPGDKPTTGDGKVTFSTRTVHGTATSAPSGDCTTMASGAMETFSQSFGGAVAVPPETPRSDLIRLAKIGARSIHEAAMRTDGPYFESEMVKGHKRQNYREPFNCPHPDCAILSVELVPPAPKGEK